MPTQDRYEIVAQNTKSTVVAKYIRKNKVASSYQNESDLERAFIQKLQEQGYEYINITSEEQLIKNLRAQLESINDIQFSDNEWEEFFRSEIAKLNESDSEKTRTIQQDFVKLLERDDGTHKNIYLLHKTNVHDNKLQVINQYATDEGQRLNRYDVTILVNGLPLVHIELKRRGVSIEEAFNQINRYQRESFWAASELFEYVQIFVISNGTHTKYYSNTTRRQHIKEKKDKKIKAGKRSSHSFEFTSWWADATNKTIPDLEDFTETFFTKHTLLNILTRYCVFTSEEQLLVMRPYQIVATEKIINKIECSTNHKKLGTIDAGGYIWHTTGSGKTLTSFKVAQLVSKMPSIDKVLFVVDRKDLDYQTMKEYDKYEKGAANSNASTKILKQQLEKRDARIIITTIQKLTRFISRHSKHSSFEKHVAIIFDECHRSQFGEMHLAIIKAFKNYHLFGFTGTPIFAVNASANGRPNLKTTEQAFGAKLHTYTIVDAISDKNVLPFRIDYVKTLREAENIKDKQVRDIDRKKALEAPQRLANVVKYILENFDRKTKRKSSYKLKDRRVAGFNSIFAVSSIDVAKKYYAEFKKQLTNAPSDKKLKIGLIYSFGANEAENEEEAGGLTDENSEDTSGLDMNSRDFLDRAIDDYNKMFGSSYNTSSDKFPNYYKDISKRVRHRELDLLIVVNMFLTGFDATTLNTLWADKNLRLHGLLQAYSRTNRILNSIKTFGNIICFRDLEEETNESIALFGDKKAGGIVLLKSYKEYYNGYKDGDKEVRGYASLIKELLEKFPIGEEIIGEQNQKDFIQLYGQILRLRNILDSFDDFDGNEILSARDTQDYHSVYIDLYNDFRKNEQGEIENINDDIVFEMELIKQVEVNIDYILELVKKYHEDHTKNKEILTDIRKTIASSMELRKKKDLIEQFIASLSVNAETDEAWEIFIEKKKIEELNQIIANENLDGTKTYEFIKNAFRDGSITTSGTALAEILPPISRFSPTGDRTKKREKVISRLTHFFDRFFDIAKF